MNNDEILQIFQRLLPFLGHVLGPGVEVVLHDVRDMDHSLLAIENSLSGRQVGEPLTELAREFFELPYY